MADDGTSIQPVELDDEGKRLQLEAEKAQYRQKIAEARAKALETIVPAVADAPKGEITLGEKAGALGPWLTHRAMDEAAKEIAGEVNKAAGKDAYVLVVRDPSLLTSDWAHRQATDSLSEMAGRLGSLKTLVDSAKNELEEAIAASQAVAAPAPEAPAERITPEIRAEVGLVDVSEGETPAEAAAGAPAEGAFGAAVALMGMLRTDYTLTATTATTTPWELPALTAAQLVGDSRQVELDDFDVIDDRSEIVVRLQEVKTSRDEVADLLADLEGLLEPLESEVTSLRTHITSLEEKWAGAVTSKEAEANKGAAIIRAQIDQLVAQSAKHEKALGPAKARGASIRQNLAGIDAAINALLTSSEGERPLLLTAIARERLHAGASAKKNGQGSGDGGSGGGETRKAYVLYVHADEATGDVITRRSILGTSGHLGFIGALNASWLLLDVDKGFLTGGGQVKPAKRMKYDLETCSGEVKDIDDNGTLSKKNPLTNLESWARGLVVAMVVILGIIAFVGMLNLLFG